MLAGAQTKSHNGPTTKPNVNFNSIQFSFPHFFTLSAFEVTDIFNIENGSDCVWTRQPSKQIKQY